MSTAARDRTYLLGPGAGADDDLTIYERSQPGRRAFVSPELDVPD